MYHTTRAIGNSDLFFCRTDYSNGIAGEYYWVDTRVIENLKPIPARMQGR